MTKKSATSKNHRAKRNSAPPEPQKSGNGHALVKPAPAAVRTQPVRQAPQPAPPARLRLVSPSAKSVFVAGTFNEWKPQATPLTKQSDEQWVVELKLGPGQYEYRFVVDGQWSDDPQAAEYTTNPFGGRNAILRVNA